jgi:deoxyribodipyrimidine photo-lyase
MTTGRVPAIRIQLMNDRPLNPEGTFVLYWMVAYRRVEWNYALDRALEWCDELQKALVILEALRVDYRWASDRLHGFVLDGMSEKALRLADGPVTYYPYVEPKKGAGKGLLRELAQRAAVVVTDDFPSFFIPHMVQAAARKLPVRLEQVDSNGLLPLRAADRVYPTAFAFRRFLQRTLPEHLLIHPRPRPLSSGKRGRRAPIPAAVRRRWPPASPGFLANPDTPGSLPIDHGVARSALSGGAGPANKALKQFLTKRLSSYQLERNQPEASATSELSPYLHFGHLSAHEVFQSLMRKEKWSLSSLRGPARGGRSGWWGVEENTEAFLDQFITWRELGFNMAWQREDCESYRSLPSWALAALKKHAVDRRAHVYSLVEFERAETHDPLWNAAQVQLLTEGVIHNYLRMLWGKKIVEWTCTPQKALAIMIELNNKYALDGRNPNSTSGIFWVLGRYDRAWGPERRIFGTVRYMSSENTARKVRVREYMERYSK